MSKFGTSQPITRLEDNRFLTGKGRYVDDLAPKGALVAYVLRSTMAHGDITDLDVSRAATPLRPILAKGRVRFVGDPVAFIVADTLEQGKDAAELIVLDVDDRPAKL